MWSRYVDQIKSARRVPPLSMRPAAYAVRSSPDTVALVAAHERKAFTNPEARSAKAAPLRALIARCRAAEQDDQVLNALRKPVERIDVAAASS